MVLEVRTAITLGKGRDGKQRERASGVLEMFSSWSGWWLHDGMCVCAGVCENSSTTLKNYAPLYKYITSYL